MRSNFHSRDLSDRNLGDVVINHILTVSANFPLSSPLLANSFKAIKLGRGDNRPLALCVRLEVEVKGIACRKNRPCIKGYKHD